MRALGIGGVPDRYPPALMAAYRDLLDVWRPWAADVSGLGMPGSHFFAEDEPERTAAELIAFLDPGGDAGVRRERGALRTGE